MHFFDCDNTVTINVTAIQLRGYGWPCVTTGLGYFMKILFCSIVADHILPDGLVTHYDIKASNSCDLAASVFHSGPLKKHLAGK
jgi:hypothetical protein